MKFTDTSEIFVSSGHGGPGLVSFRAAKNAPKLGPDGGDGGFGGNVYLVGTTQLNTLSHLYYRKIYKAENGARGGPNNRTGKNGADVEIPVPLGTVAINVDTGAVICEVLEDGEKIMIAKGGKRGLGNYRFLSSTHQAPEENTPGGPGIEIRLGLELKLIADVGFAGFPNAGKSSLLSRISAARPKIADYPFTTLVPNLGVVDLSDVKDSWDKSFVAADIPGLVEGASEGRGLGHEFLKHLERTKVIAYVVDAFSFENPDPMETLIKLQHELKQYSPILAAKKSVVVLTKSDLTPPDFDWSELLNQVRNQVGDALVVSSHTGDGIKELKLYLYGLVQDEKQKVTVEAGQTPVPDEGFEVVTRATEDDDLGF